MFCVGLGLQSRLEEHGVHCSDLVLTGDLSYLALSNKMNSITPLVQLECCCFSCIQIQRGFGPHKIWDISTNEIP